jgi:hypothetical protein
MSVVKAAVMGAAVFAGIASSVNANAACRAGTGECQPSTQYFAARSNPSATSTAANVTLPEITVAAPYSCRGLGPRVSSFAANRTEHYEVPADFDANVQLHPYTSGMGPWPGPGNKGHIEKPPSHYNRWPWVSGRPDARGEFTTNGAAPTLSR